MIRTLTKYGKLVKNAKMCERELHKIGVWQKGVEGRFQTYIKSVDLLDQALKKGLVPEFLKENNQHGEMFFKLKQLYEFTSILSSVLPFLATLPINQKKELVEKLKIALTGPVLPEDENHNNNSPRNNMFELLVLSKLLRSGYKNIQIFKNPDILLIINKRQYPIECKRIITLNERGLISALNTAINQIKNNWKKNFFKGVVAIDITPLLEQGNNILDSGGIYSAEASVQNKLEKVFNSIYLRSKKLRKINGEIIGILLNVSCVYIVPGTELGWMNQIAVGVLNKENPEEGSIFIKDLNGLQKPLIEDE
ncbi:MAG: hypothetical protein Q7T59_05620 [Candidatus Woesebacteria bacterium]|nr:hypothetical protein [Candidatus Woesebacteria bacterium]